MTRPRAQTGSDTDAEPIADGDDPEAAENGPVAENTESSDVAETEPLAESTEASDVAETEPLAESTEAPDVADTEPLAESTEAPDAVVDAVTEEEAPPEEEPMPPDEESGEPPPAAGAGAPQELFYDPVFAWRAGLALGIVFVLLVWPLWILAARIIVGGHALDRFPASVALTLVLVGVALAVGGLYLALLEFRARARVVAAAASAESVRTRGMASDVVTAAPDILKAFGQLTTVAALLVVAIVLCICGTVLAWHGLP